MRQEELKALLRDNPDLSVIPDVGNRTTSYIHPADDTKLSEHQHQVRVINWVDENKIHVPALHLLFAVPNGGGRTNAQGAMLKKEGVRRGVPDLLLPYPSGDRLGLAIEMKVRPNRPTSEQVEWLTRLEKVGWETHVCYSAEDAIQRIRVYLLMGYG